jgi:tetratricopeptide (TPR) repeat protein
MGKARQAFQRMQSIRTEGRLEYALRNYLMAAFLQKAGQWREAEAEYLKALTVFRERGPGDSADEGSVLCGLGSLYGDERRYAEAEQILARALATFSAAKDTVPVDIVKLLELRGSLYIRMARWEQAEADLQTALSIVDRESCNDPIILRPLLVHYARVLRKMHRGHEASSLDARAASFRATGTANVVVDVTDLRRGSQVR